MPEQGTQTSTKSLGSFQTPTGPRIVEFKDHKAVVGRHQDAEFSFGSNEVSRRHAEFYRDGESLWVRDLNSSNGTYVDGVRIGSEDWKQLDHHSQISLGRNPENVLSFGSSIAGKRVDPRFEASAGNGLALDLPAEGSEFVWGRGSDADHKFSPELGVVSRKHLAVRQNAGGFWVKDLGSSYGTFLDGSQERLPANEWVEVPTGSTVSLAGVLDLKFGAKTRPLPQVNSTSNGPQGSPKASTAAAQTLPEARALSAEDGQRILSRAQITPSPVGRPKGVADLTLEFLTEQGFEPKTTVKVGETSLHFSKPYSHAGRDNVVGYVEKPDGSISVRTFYRSSSHGLWKVASHGAYGGWFGKGIGQESVTLPISAQKAMGQHSAVVGEVSEEAAERLFYGGLEVGGMLPPSDFMASTTEELLELSASASDKSEPKNLDLRDPSDRPRFSVEPSGFVMHSRLQGAIEAEVYPSGNGKYDYMFCTDSEGRSWLGGVFPSESPLQGYGVPSRSVNSRGLATPALEYLQKAEPEYSGKQVNEDYVDYSAYSQQIPVVKDYLAVRSRSRD